MIERRTRSITRLARLAAASVAMLCAAGSALAQPQPHPHGGREGQPRGGYGGAPAEAPWRSGPPQAPRGGPQGYDPRQHNGYWVGPRWYYGRPAGPALRAPGYRPGFAPWRPGAFLPPHYQAYVIDEYWRFHLRRPPPGYHWVQAGNEFLLVSLSTGQIFDVVTAF